MFKVEKILKRQSYYTRPKPPDVYVDDFKHCVSYNTEYEHSCEDSGCDDEGICRCGRLVDLKVESDLNGINYFFTNSYEDTASGIDRALDHWFTRKHFQDISWGFEAEGGYYGEELGRVFPDHDNDFFNKANMFKALSPKEKVEFMLTREYGRVLPSVQKVKDWELKPILTSDIIQSECTRRNTQVLENYKDFCRTIVRRDRTKFQEETSVLAPLTLKSGKGYQVIDGRHRTEALTSPYVYEETIKRVIQVNKKRKNGATTIVNRNLSNTEMKDFIPVYMWIICPKETK